MSAVSETIVRDYFELHEFLVRQHRKYISQMHREEAAVLILAVLDSWCGWDLLGGGGEEAGKDSKV